MEMAPLAQRLGVAHKATIAKAKEYQRLSAMRGGSGGTKMSIETQAVVCLDLACKFHAQSTNSAMFLKYSGCKTAAAYGQLTVAMSQALGLSTAPGTKELAVQHGCIQAHDVARRLLARYRQATTDELVRTNTTPADIAAKIALMDSRGAFAAAAFSIACKALKIVGIDRKALAQQVGSTEKELLSVLQSFYTLLPDTQPPERAPPKKRKKPAAAAAADGGAESKEADADESKDDAGDSGDAEDAIPVEDGAEEERAEAAEASRAPAAAAGGKQLGLAKWKKKVVEEAREEARMIQPLLKKRKGDPASCISATSASPSDDASVAAAFLKQSRINFAPASDSAAASQRKQLKADSGDEGEAEY